MSDIQVIDVHKEDILRQVGALIRRAFATVADELKLTRSNCPYHPAFLSDEALLRDLGRADAFCFGAYSQKEMIGFTALLPKEPNVMELAKLCVNPTHRHGGTGLSLLVAAQAYAKKRGARKLALDMIDENRRLKEWYLANGFVPTRTVKYPHLPFTVCDMEKAL